MPVRAFATDSDLRAELLPAELLPLFDGRFIASCDLIEEYVFRLALKVARETGFDRPLLQGGAVLLQGGAAEEIARRAGLDSLTGAPLADWLLRLLAERGVIARSAGEPSVFQALEPLPDLNPTEIERAQAAHDPDALPSFRLAALAAEGYPHPPVMRGEASGEAVLFAADRISAWSEYFSNHNPLYAISNQIGARAVLARFTHPRGAILEIGGGAGSGATALAAGRRLCWISSRRRARRPGSRLIASPNCRRCFCGAASGCCDRGPTRRVESAAGCSTSTGLSPRPAWNPAV